MATTIKETPVLRGEDAQKFLKKLVNGTRKVSKEELKKRREAYEALEVIRRF